MPGHKQVTRMNTNINTCNDDEQQSQLGKFQRRKKYINTVDEEGGQDLVSLDKYHDYNPLTDGDTTSEFDTSPDRINTINKFMNTQNHMNFNTANNHRSPTLSYSLSETRASVVSCQDNGNLGGMGSKGVVKMINPDEQQIDYNSLRQELTRTQQDCVQLRQRLNQQEEHHKQLSIEFHQHLKKQQEQHKQQQSDAEQRHQQMLEAVGELLEALRSGQAPRLNDLSCQLEEKEEQLKKQEQQQKQRELQQNQREHLLGLVKMSLDVERKIEECRRFYCVCSDALVTLSTEYMEIHQVMEQAEAELENLENLFLACPQKLQAVSSCVDYLRLSWNLFEVQEVDLSTKLELFRVAIERHHAALVETKELIQIRQEQQSQYWSERNQELSPTAKKRSVNYYSYTHN